MTNSNSKVKGQKSKVWLALFLIPLAAAACNAKPAPLANLGATVTINGHKLNVEMASTQAAQLKGLSGRDSMAEDHAMLFVFQASKRYSFWMKDMKFPLDLIWIQNNQVVEITANTPPESEKSDSNLKVYTSAEPVNMVLEVNAGWAAANNIKVGDRVDQVPSN